MITYMPNPSQKNLELLFIFYKLLHLYYEGLHDKVHHLSLHWSGISGK